jgi:hypothetical protein
MSMPVRITVVLFAFLLVSSATVLAQSAIRNGEILKIDITARSFVIKTARGETKVVTTEKTVVKDGEKTVTFEDLKVGDSVRVIGVRKDEDVEASEVLKQPKQAGNQNQPIASTVSTPGRTSGSD